MVLRNSGRVGSCRFIEGPFRVIGRDSLFFVMYRSFPSSPFPRLPFYDNGYAGYADNAGNRCLPFPACPESIVFFRGYGRIHTLYAKNVCFGFIILLFILSCRITPFTFLFLISLYPSYYDGYVVYNKR